MREGSRLIGLQVYSLNEMTSFLKFLTSSQKNVVQVFEECNLRTEAVKSCGLRSGCTDYERMICGFLPPPPPPPR